MYSSAEVRNGNEPIISYVKPVVRYNNNLNGMKPFSVLKKLNDEVIKIKQQDNPKSRKKRGIVDMLQNAYLYWINKLLNINNNKKLYPKYPKYKIINGVKYIYYPIRQIQKQKSPKEIQNNNNNIKTVETDGGFKPIVIAEDFNKGEIVEGPVESRMSKKKIKNLKDSVNEAMEDNPWQ